MMAIWVVQNINMFTDLNVYKLKDRRRSMISTTLASSGANKEESNDGYLGRSKHQYVHRSQCVQVKGQKKIDVVKSSASQD
jgi:hypothetical protein